MHVHSLRKACVGPKVQIDRKPCGLQTFELEEFLEKKRKLIDIAENFDRERFKTNNRTHFISDLFESKNRNIARKRRCLRAHTTDVRSHSGCY